MDIESMKKDLPIAVQQAGDIKLHGTLIDDGWLQHIRFDNGKPHLVAILILSEIIYWYRPTVILNEEDSQIKEIKKKFKADKLQKSYQALADRLGVTKRQAQDACKFLSALKLITIEQRTVEWKDDKKLGNVTFLEPVIENVRKISCMCKEYIDPITFQRDSLDPVTLESDSPITVESDTPIPSESNTPVTPESDTLHRLPVPQTTSVTETPVNSQSVSLSGDDGSIDGLEEILKVLSHEYIREQKIRPEFLKSIEGAITHLYFLNSFEVEGADIPQKIVRKVLAQLTPYCIDHTYNKFNEYTKVNDIANPKRYLQVILYNSVHDEELSMMSKVNYDVHGNGRTRS